jgi:hypothetical protein
MKRLLLLGALGTAGLSSAAQLVCGIGGSPTTAPATPGTGPAQVQVPGGRGDGDGNGGNGGQGLANGSTGASAHIGTGSHSASGGASVNTGSGPSTGAAPGAGAGGSNGGGGSSSCTRNPIATVDADGNQVLDSAPGANESADGSVAVGGCRLLDVDVTGSGNAGS